VFVILIHPFIHSSHHNIVRVVVVVVARVVVCLTMKLDRISFLTMVFLAMQFLISERYLDTTQHTAQSSALVIDQIFPTTTLISHALLRPESQLDVLLSKLVHALVFVILSGFLAHVTHQYRAQYLAYMETKQTTETTTTTTTTETPDIEYTSDTKHAQQQLQDDEDQEYDEHEHGNTSSSDDDDDADADAVAMDNCGDGSGSESTSSEAAPSDIDSDDQEQVDGGSDIEGNDVLCGVLDALPALPLVIPVFELLSDALIVAAVHCNQSIAIRYSEHEFNQVLPATATISTSTASSTSLLVRMLLYNATLLDLSSVSVFVVSLGLGVALLCLSQAHWLHQSPKPLFDANSEIDDDIDDDEQTTTTLSTCERAVLLAEIQELRQMLHQEREQRHRQVHNLQRQIDSIIRHLHATPTA
jgi:hypothetical protein